MSLFQKKAENAHRIMTRTAADYLAAIAIFKYDDSRPAGLSEEDAADWEPPMPPQELMPYIEARHRAQRDYDNVIAAWRGIDHVAASEWVENQYKEDLDAALA